MRGRIEIKAGNPLYLDVPAGFFQRFPYRRFDKCFMFLHVPGGLIQYSGAVGHLFYQKKFSFLLYNGCNGQMWTPGSHSYFTFDELVG